MRKVGRSRVAYLQRVKNFERWYRTDDTAAWDRMALRFLLVGSVALVLGLLAWLLWSGLR